MIPSAIGDRRAPTVWVRFDNQPHGLAITPNPIVIEADCLGTLASEPLSQKAQAHPVRGPKRGRCFAAGNRSSQPGTHSLALGNCGSKEDFHGRAAPANVRARHGKSEGGTTGVDRHPTRTTRSPRTFSGGDASFGAHSRIGRPWTAPHLMQLRNPGHWHRQLTCTCQGEVK